MSPGQWKCKKCNVLCHCETLTKLNGTFSSFLHKVYDRRQFEQGLKEIRCLIFLKRSEKLALKEFLKILLDKKFITSNPGHTAVARHAELFGKMAELNGNQLPERKKAFQEVRQFMI